MSTFINTILPVAGAVSILVLAVAGLVVVVAVCKIIYAITTSEF